MKRRSFISSSMLGATGIALTSCSGITAKNQASPPMNYRISDLAPTPPLGWNSFDSYGVYLHQEAAMANLKAMAEKLKPHGYEYFVIDAGWFGEFKLAPGTMYSMERHAKELNMNEYGLLQPSKTYFPNGFKPIVDYAHELGLKMGIHLMRGIPRKAVERNLPVKNTPYKAQDIADVNSICAWNDQNYGLDMDKPGAQEFYNALYAQVAEWGFDFVKVDDLVPFPREIVAIANAIENSGRKMVYSLSPGGHLYMPDLIYYKRANMIRTTHDIWDRRSDIDKAFEAWKEFQGISFEGFWPDLDMIPFGNLQMMSPAKYADGSTSVALAGLGNTRKSRLTPAQMRTFITVRALAASPLMMGGDLPTLDDYSLELITNKEMLACNQNGECGTQIYEKDGVEVWLVQQKNLPYHGWIGIFNRTEGTKSVELTRENLGLMRYYKGNTLEAIKEPIRFTDIWKSTTSLFGGNSYNASLEADDVAFIKFSLA
jgi:hypothetical protein